MNVAIIGAGIEEKELIPKLKDYDEIWSVNNLFRQFQNVKFTRWFELHQFQCVNNVFTRRNRSTYGSFITINNYLSALNKLDIPVMMRVPYKRIKQGEKFPFKELMKFFSTDYFGCSFTWMTAYAIYHGVKRINYLGVTLGGNEYFYQRPSLEYFIGIAQGRGVHVYIDESSTLLKESYIYAYKENFDLIYFLHGEFMRHTAQSIIIEMSDRIEGMTI